MTGVQTCALPISGFYLATILDFYGLQYVSAGLERLILSMQPTLVLFISALMFGTKITRYHILGIGICYSGIIVMVISQADIGISDRMGLGTVLIFLSALSYSIYLIIAGRLVSRVDTLTLSSLASIIACVLAILHFLFVKGIEGTVNIPINIVYLSMINGALCTVIPVLAMTYGIRTLGAPLASQVSMIGPILTVVLGAVFLNEKISLGVAFSVFLVIGGIYFFTRDRQ